MTKKQTNRLRGRAFSSLLVSRVMCFLLVAMASGLTRDAFGMILLQMLLMAVFLGLPAFNFRRIGLEDQAAVAAGDRPEERWRGLRLTLPGLLFLEAGVAALLLMKCSILPDAVYVYKLLNPQFVGRAWFLAPVTSVAGVSWPDVLCFALLPLLYPLAAQTGYWSGYRDTHWI